MWSGEGGGEGGVGGVAEGTGCDERDRGLDLGGQVAVGARARDLLMRGLIGPRIPRSVSSRYEHQRVVRRPPVAPGR